jgi:hypothetical protein
MKLLENRTQEYIIETSIPFAGKSAGNAEKEYFNLTFNVSGAQLNPGWYYKAYLVFPGNIKISNSFYAQEPMNKCSLLPLIGHCTWETTRYYFNRTTQKCEEFTYSGCGGVSPFQTLEECVESCE